MDRRIVRRRSITGGTIVEPIGTERLVIRNFGADDWRDLQEISAKYKASQYAQYDQEWPTSSDKVKGMVEWFAQGDRFLAVCLETTNKVIGLISLNPKQDQEGRVFGLGYVLNSDHLRQGYGTESCRAAVDFAFGELEADRVIVNTALANEPSCRLVKRLGFRETDRGTGSFRQTPDGKPIEFVRVSFALSREEWQAENR
jgi:RimJ/RimL family protein N-acetyltransferase